MTTDEISCFELKLISCDTLISRSHYKLHPFNPFLWEIRFLINMFSRIQISAREWQITRPGPGRVTRDRDSSRDRVNEWKTRERERERDTQHGLSFAIKYEPGLSGRVLRGRARSETPGIKGNYGPGDLSAVTRGELIDDGIPGGVN